MASGKFHVGLPDKHNEIKHSTASIIRGAHTDIFGTSESAQPTPKKQVSASNNENSVMEDNNAEKIQIKADSNVDNTDDPKPSIRVRMPPGGFSSKLW